MANIWARLIWYGSGRVLLRGTMSLQTALQVLPSPGRSQAPSWVWIRQHSWQHSWDGLLCSVYNSPSAAQTALQNVYRTHWVYSCSISTLIGVVDSILWYCIVKMIQCLHHMPFQRWRTYCHRVIAHRMIRSYSITFIYTYVESIVSLTKILRILV